MKFTCLLLFLCCTQLVWSQADELIFVNGMDVSEDRYPEIKGSPYLFDDWHSADLLTSGMKKIKGIPTRFNAYTGEFEVRQDDKYILLELSRFMRIKFSVDEKGNPVENDADGLVFQAGFHPVFRGKFVNIIYPGREMILVRNFDSSVSEKTVQDVGKTVEFKRFLHREEYFLLSKGELHPVKLNKKGLIKVLGNKKALEDYIRDNDLDLDTHRDLRKLLTFAETLG